MNGIKTLIRNHYYNTRAMCYLTQEQFMRYPEYRKGEAIADSIVKYILITFKTLYALFLLSIASIIVLNIYDI